MGLENGHHMLSEGAVVGMDKFSSDNNCSVFLGFKCHPTADISDILYGVISYRGHFLSEHTFVRNSIYPSFHPAMGGNVEFRLTCVTNEKHLSNTRALGCKSKD